MNFQDLLRQDLPKELSDEIEQMLLIKANSDEKDLNPRMPVIQKYIEDEIVRYDEMSKNMEDDRTKDWDVLNQVFLLQLL